MILLIFMTISQALRTIELTEEYAEVIVMQSIQETYIVQILNSQPNSTFTYVQSYPNCPQLQVESSVNQTFHKQFPMNAEFCPISDWAPLFQPVHFYLSINSIDLIIYDNQNFTEITATVHVDLDETLTCMCIFSYGNQPQFLIDCTQNQNQSLFLIYQLDYNPETLIVTNFTYLNYFSYNYENASIEAALKVCPYRETLAFKYLNYHDPTSPLLYDSYIQYCPGNSPYYAIFKLYNEKPNKLELFAYQISDSLTSFGCPQGNIYKTVANPLYESFNNDTWNIAFFFQGYQGICKCLFNVSEELIGEIFCNFGSQQMLESSFLKVIQTIDNQLLLVTGSQTSVHLTYLTNNVYSDNQVGIAYKYIYEEGYYLIDASVSQQYLSVILSQNPQNNQQTLFNQCFYGQTIQPESTNILKVYQLDKQSAWPYYQVNIANNVFLIENLNYMQFGDYLLYFQANVLYQVLLLEKQLQFKYNPVIEQSYYCSDPNITTQEYYPIIVEITETGLISTKNQYIIICLIPENWQEPQMINTKYYLNRTDIHTLAQCPTSHSNLYDAEMISQIPLLDGIMGTLLTFYYIPNTTESVFYPYYFNYFDYVPIVIGNKNVANLSEIVQIYSGWIQNHQRTNQPQSLDLMINFAHDSSSIYKTSCFLDQTQTKENIIQKLNLEFNDCETQLFQSFQTIKNIDYYRTIDQFSIAAQYNHVSIEVCMLKTTYCTQIQGNFTNQIIRKMVIEGAAQTLDIKYFYLTILDTTDILQFYYFVINTQSLTQSANQTFLINTIDRKVLDFIYDLSGEQFLAILYNDAIFGLYTRGPTSLVFSPTIYNFTTQLYLEAFPECTDFNNIGFDILSSGNIYKNHKFILIWCNVRRSSYLFQYSIFSVSQIHFWRQIPLYGQLIDLSLQIFVSESCLYVPIQRYQITNQQYYVYNLFDETPRMLRQQISFQLHSLRMPIVMKIKSLVDSVADSNLVSYALILTDVEMFVYYINTNAYFVFKLQEQYYSDFKTQNLIVGIQQYGNPLASFRKYNISFDYFLTFCRIYSRYSESSLQMEKYLNSSNLLYQNILINQSLFAGPIVGYSVESSNPDVSIMTTTYFQQNKLLGNYYSTIEELSEVIQIKALSDPKYNNLFNFGGLIADSETYKDLIIVLTKTNLVFLQKESNKTADPSRKCNFVEYNQSKSSNSDFCYIRIITKQNIQKLEELGQFCRVIIIQINQVIYQCLGKDNSMSAQIIQFEYNQSNNSVQLIQILTQSAQAQYQFAFADTESLYYADKAYLIVKQTYSDTNTFLGIYYINIGSDSKFSFEQITVLPQNQDLFNYSYSFSMSLLEYNETTNPNLLILIQQKGALIVNILDLQNNFALLNQSVIYTKQLSNQTAEKFAKVIDEQTIQYIQILNPNNSYPDLTLLLTGDYFNLEVVLSLASMDLTVQYFFQKYFLCAYDTIIQSQFILNSKNSIEYLVDVCPSESFNYQPIFEEMVTMFGYQNQNLLYIQLFVRNQGNISYPVQILEPVFINPEKLDFFEYQLYVTHLHNKTQNHIIMNNSTYFLSDYFINNQINYTIVHPATQSNVPIPVTVTAFNIYNNNSILFNLDLPQSIQTYHNTSWFYAILIIIIALLILSAVMCIRTYTDQKQTERIYVGHISFDDELEMEHVRRKSTSNQLYRDLIHSALTNN